jgi:hypothetical protein
VQERALLRADVDKGGLDAGKDCVYTSNEDVTDQSLDVWPVDEQLNQLIVFENGDSCFSIYSAYEDFAFHREPSPDRHHATRGCTCDWAVKEVVR